jgi:hypothetical protein
MGDFRPLLFLSSCPRLGYPLKRQYYLLTTRIIRHHVGRAKRVPPCPLRRAEAGRPHKRQRMKRVL